MSQLSILNIAAYKFVELSDLPLLKERLLSRANQLGIKGTILLTPEGINMFLAAIPEALNTYLNELKQIPAFTDLEVKESYSSQIPFKRMLIKLKQEIIRMNHPTIRPINGRAPAVDVHTLERWLKQGHDDEQRPIAMLDTRNDYEVDTGTFNNAIDWRLKCFTEFPEAVKNNMDDLKGKTIVSFCTGGIRCEKAAIYLQDMGVEHVYQLDGGILKYFEDTEAYDYHGSCFVFDERRAVDTNLQAAPETAVEAYQLP